MLQELVADLAQRPVKLRIAIGRSPGPEGGHRSLLRRQEQSRFCCARAARETVTKWHPYRLVKSLVKASFELGQLVTPRFAVYIMRDA